MKKTDHHHLSHHGGGGGGEGKKSEMIGEDEVLIRPFKKLKVSRLGKCPEEKSNNHWSVSKNHHLWGIDSSPPSLGHSSFRFRPSRLSSVQNNRSDSSPTQDNEESSSSTWRRSNGVTKDFSSIIIRRFDTISLSGAKRKKKRPDEDPETSLPEEDRLEKTVNCATQARQTYNDVSVDDLAGYLENSMVFPKKMSYMAEMMYT